MIGDAVTLVLISRACCYGDELIMQWLYLVEHLVYRKTWSSGSLGWGSAGKEPDERRHRARRACTRELPTRRAPRSLSAILPPPLRHHLHNTRMVDSCDNHGLETRVSYLHIGATREVSHSDIYAFQDRAAKLIKKISHSTGPHNLGPGWGVLVNEVR